MRRAPLGHGALPGSGTVGQVSLEPDTVVSRRVRGDTRPKVSDRTGTLVPVPLLMPTSKIDEVGSDDSCNGHWANDSYEE